MSCPPMIKGEQINAIPPATYKSPATDYKNALIGGQAVLLIGFASALYGEMTSDIDANTVAISAIVDNVRGNTTRSIDSEGEINRLWDQVLGR